MLSGQARRKLGEIFHALARQKECQIIEGHLLPDHVHMCIAIPPKYPVSGELLREPIVPAIALYPVGVNDEILRNAL